MRLSITLLLLLTAFPFARGQTVYWDINSTTTGATNSSSASGTWSASSGNTWTTSSAGTSSTTTWASAVGTTATAAFSAGSNATGASTITVSGNIGSGSSDRITGLLFEEGTYTFGGTGTLYLRSGGITNNTANTQTINANIVLSAAQTWNNAGGGGLTVNDAFTFNQNLTFSGSGAFSLAGTVTQSGSRTLTHNGTGGLTFGDYVQGNTLTLNGTGTTSSTGTWNVNGNRTLTLNNANGLTLNNVTLGGTWTVGGTGLLSAGGTVTLTGNRTVNLNNTGAVSFTNINLSNSSTNRTLTIGGTNNATISGVIANGGTSTAGGLTKTGSGTLTLVGNNTYGGLTTVSSGTVVLAHGNALGSTSTGTTVASSATLAFTNNIAVGNEAIANSGTITNTSGINSYAGVISGTGNLTVAAGQFTLTGDNTFSGNVTVASGSTLVAASNNALGTGGTTTVQNGGTLALQGGISSSTETMINLAGTGNGGNGALLNTSGTNTLVSNITLNGATTIGSTGGTLQIGNPANPAWPVQGTIAMGANDLTFAATGGNIFLRETLTGTGDVYKTGSGTLTVKNGFNDGSTADFFIQDGTLILDTFNNENLGIMGNVTVGDGTGAAGSARFQQGELESGSGLSNNLISDSSNIIINADGYWDLQGYKEVVNNVTLNGGTIEAKNNSGTGDRLDIIGVLSAAGGTTSTIDGRLGMNNDTAKSIVVDTGATLDINAVLSNGGFDKTGDGTLILSGANTFTGTALVSDGILRVDNNSGLGATAGGTQVLSGAQLQLDHVTIGAESLSLAGTGHNADGSGALRALTGTTNTWGGAVSLTANAEIQTDASAALVINGGITGSGRTLTVDSIGTTTFNGINTFNTLNKNGAGTLTVTNTNTYATANVNAGTFALGASNILADTMDVHLGAAGTFNVGSYTDVIDDLTGSGTLTIASGGDLTIDKIGGSLSSGNPTGAFTGVLDVDGILTLNGGTIGAANGVGSTGTIELTANSTLNIAGNFTFGGTLELADNTTLNLVNNGTTFNVDTLRVTGDSVIDFAGVNVATLNIGTLEIQLGGTILATSWASFYDLWTATNFSGATLDERNATTAQITFSGFSADQTIWLTYDYGANEITVPEPSTYGALMMGTLGALYVWRRKRRAGLQPALDRLSNK